MNNFLNTLEFAIFQEVLKTTDSKNRSYLVEHLPYLKIVERKFTGVGLLIFLDYDINHTLTLLNDYNLNLGSRKSIKFNDFNEYFSFEVSVKMGKITIIEIVTYASGWSGQITSFDFIE